MTAESACRDKNAKISIGTSIIADSIDLLFGEIKIAKLGAFVLQSAASLNDFRAIDACKGK
jgi:hypothetical protein